MNLLDTITQPASQPEKYEPLTYEKLVNFYEQLGEQQKWWGSSGYELKPSWLIEQGVIFLDDGSRDPLRLSVPMKSIVAHPFTLSIMVASICDPITGLDMLRKYLHEDIDSKFKQLKRKE